MATKLVSLDLLGTQITETQSRINALKSDRENALNSVLSFQEDILKQTDSLVTLEEEREMIYRKFPESRPVNYDVDRFEFEGVNTGTTSAVPKKTKGTQSITLDDIRKFIIDNNLGGSAKVKTMLKDFGADKLSELDEDDYIDFYTAIQYHFDGTCVGPAKENLTKTKTLWND